MSDLLAASSGQGRAYNGATRGATGPIPVPRGPGAAPGPSAGTGIRGVRSPVDIMAERARRQQEAAEAQISEEQRRATDLERRRSAERRAQAAGVAGQPPRDSGYRSQQIGDQTPARPSYVSDDLEPSGGYERSGATASAAYPPSRRAAQASDASARQQQYSQGSSRQQAAPQPQQTSTQSTQSSRQTQPPVGASSGSADPSSQQPRSNVSSFPHAFERWEDLSSRWEGLTSYWLRRLENSSEVRNDPIAQHMSRQITDLTAAGANLFHAVVELQRLRASSERKFQRWFFETRAEQERLQEDKQRLQNEIESQREAGRADLSGFFAKAEQDRLASQRHVDQMRRELQISKDEARRAWEELGKREQEERERMYALKEGKAVTVGGVNVLPVAAPSRGPSSQRPAVRDQPPYLTTTQGDYELQQPSPTDTDPFTEAGRAGGGFGNYPQQPPMPMSSMPNQAIQLPAQESQSSSGMYARPPQAPTAPTASSSQRGYPQPAARFSPASEESEDDGGYALNERGEIQYDTQGRPIPFRRGPDPAIAPRQPVDIEAEDLNREQRRAAQFGRSESSTQVPQTAEPRTGGGYSGEEVSPADYEGEGYGAGTGWEGMPRHQHPTSLSDVLEEDEYSQRTST